MKKGLLIIVQPASGGPGCGIVALILISLPFLIVLGFIASILQGIGFGLKHIITPPMPVTIVAQALPNVTWQNSETLTYSQIRDPLPDEFRNYNGWGDMLWDFEKREWVDTVNNYSINIHSPNNHQSLGVTYPEYGVWSNERRALLRSGATALSPDRTSRVFSRRTGRTLANSHDEEYEVIVSQANGSNERFITYAQCELFFWSPDGNHLACLGWQLYQGEFGYFLKIIRDAGSR